MELAAAQTLRMSLLDNAYDSFAESLSYVERAGDNPSRWKFAVLHLVHAVELLLKKRLADEHPLLVWKDVDTPGRSTVGLDSAIKRLQAASVALSQEDKQAITAAVKWRNNITHYEVDLVIDEVRENYLLIFEFLYEFHQEHFEGAIFDRIPAEHLQTAADLVEQFQREFVDFHGHKMHRAWMQRLVNAQSVPLLYIGETAYERRTYGNELFWHEPFMQDHVPAPYCRDCGARVGEYHGPGCCVEECPKEHGQLFGCECAWEPSELWAYEPDDDSLDVGGQDVVDACWRR